MCQHDCARLTKSNLPGAWRNCKEKHVPDMEKLHAGIRIGYRATVAPGAPPARYGTVAADPRVSRRTQFISYVRHGGREQHQKRRTGTSDATRLRFGRKGGVTDNKSERAPSPTAGGLRPPDSRGSPFFRRAGDGKKQDRAAMFAARKEPSPTQPRYSIRDHAGLT